MPDTVFWPDFSMHFSQRRTIPYHALFQVQQKIIKKKIQDGKVVQSNKKNYYFKVKC